MNAQSTDAEFRTGAAAEALSAAIADLPIYDPARPQLSYDLPKAWRHFKNLVKNKEDTREVFPIFEALPWKGLPAAAEAFLASPRGQAVRASEPFLPELLDEHAALRRVGAPDSLAHAYCDFMEREGLTAQGLVDEYDAFVEGGRRFDDQFQWYFDRLRDTHDLLHVLTGYGRDALGEQCVLAFTYGQQPSPAHLFLGYMGGWELNKRFGKSVPIFRAVREGQRLGKACPRLVEQSIHDLLPLPLDEARRRLNITPARFYEQAHAAWRAEGLDPYALLASQQAMAA